MALSLASTEFESQINSLIRDQGGKPAETLSSFRRRLNLLQEQISRMPMAEKLATGEVLYVELEKTLILFEATLKAMRLSQKSDTSLPKNRYRRWN